MTTGPDEREMAAGKESLANERMGSELPWTASESDLVAALRPVEPPPGFAERVLAAAAAQALELDALQISPSKPPTPTRKVLPFRTWRAAVGSAVAACLVAGSFALQELHHEQERRHHRAVANQQFEAATRITDQALAHTRDQLRRSGVLQAE